MTDDDARDEGGLEMVRATQGPEASGATFADVLPFFADDAVTASFVDVYGREGLSLAQRELLTVAVLTAFGGAEPQLGVHVRAALRVGVSPHEIVEAMIQVAVHARHPRSTKGHPGRQADLRRAGRHGALVLVTGPRGRLPLAG